jgi:glycosyltransferase domain-containing protein
MFSDLTVVIPTRNRPSFLQRQLRHLTESVGVSALVSDSSDPEIAEEIREIVRSAGEGVELVSHPTPVRTFPSIASVAPRVRTPYVIRCNDDDLLVPDGLQCAVDLLDSSPSAVAVVGDLYQFPLEGVSATPGPLAGPVRSAPLQHPCPLERLATAARSTWWHLACSVKRTEVFQDAFRLIDEAGMDWLFAEIVASLHPATRGVIEAVRHPLYLVQRHQEQVSRSTQGGWGDVLLWLRRESWREHCEQVRASFSAGLATSEAPPGEVAAVVDGALLHVLSKICGNRGRQFLASHSCPAPASRTMGSTPPASEPIGSPGATPISESGIAVSGCGWDHPSLTSCLAALVTPAEAREEAARPSGG